MTSWMTIMIVRGYKNLICVCTESHSNKDDVGLKMINLVFCNKLTWKNILNIEVYMLN